MKTEDKILLIIQGIADRKFLKDLLKEYQVDNGVFFSALEQAPLLENMYERARKIAAEHHLDDLIDIADNSEDAAKARNRIDVRKWIMAKTNPKKYADRVDINHSHTIDIGAALSEAKMRSVGEIAPVKHQQLDSSPQLLETTATKTVDAPDLKSSSDLNILDPDEMLK